jgi:hypothetical protein
MGEMVRYGIVGSGTMGREHISNLRLRDQAQILNVLAAHRAAADDAVAHHCA